MELDEILSRTAHSVAETGTDIEAATLNAMAHAAKGVAPGAAAALVDWAGPEIARLRAFGIVHGVIRNDLEASEQDALFAELTGAASMALVA